jgi:hypothetical protein
MSAHDLEVATVMAKVAQDLDKSTSRAEVLSRITDCARGSIPGADYASITIRYRDGRLETVAPTDNVTLRADALQYELREGPCYEAASNQDAVSSPDIRSDERWPRYGPAAARLGLRSQLAVRFYENPQSRGALNLYAAVEGQLTDQLPIAELFAKHAAIAMGHTYTVDGLQNALVTRKVIGQAIGIVMERYQLDEDRAFAFLVRASSHGNVKIRDIAAEMVHQVNTRAWIHASDPEAAPTAGYDLGVFWRVEKLAAPARWW